MSTLYTVCRTVLYEQFEMEVGKGPRTRTELDSMALKYQEYGIGANNFILFFFFLNWSGPSGIRPSLPAFREQHPVFSSILRS